jgi:hypothetical protein
MPSLRDIDDPELTGPIVRILERAPVNSLEVRKSEMPCQRLCVQRTMSRAAVAFASEREQLPGILDIDGLRRARVGIHFRGLGRIRRLKIKPALDQSDAD